MWILGYTAFHVAGGLIHLLLVFAMISIIWHLVAGSGQRSKFALNRLVWPGSIRASLFFGAKDIKISGF
jgi:hypothetical protein